MMSGTRTSRLATSLISAAFAAVATVSVADDTKHTPFTNPLTNQCFNCHAVKPSDVHYPADVPPKIAGQDPDYLVMVMDDYRSGVRNNYLMNSPATYPAEDELNPLSIYLSGLVASDLPTYPAEELDQKDIENGQAVAAIHCAHCHAPNRADQIAGSPTLNGQYTSYFLSAMQDYRLGVRTNLEMHELHSGYTTAELQALAAYYASLEGLYPGVTAAGTD